VKAACVASPRRSKSCPPRLASFVSPLRATLGPRRFHCRAHVAVTRPRRLFLRNGRTFGSPRRAIRRALSSRTPRASPGRLVPDCFSAFTPSALGSSPDPDLVGRFSFRCSPRFKCQDMHIVISPPFQRIELEHPSRSRQTEKHWENRNASDRPKRVEKRSSGIFIGSQTVDPLETPFSSEKVAFSRGVSFFCRSSRDLVRDLPRAHLNARVHRDRDVHPLTRGPTGLGTSFPP